MQTENKNQKAQINSSLLTSGNSYFIPEIKIINGVKVPSTPFINQNGEPIFLGDVVKIEFKDNDHTFNEINLVDLIDGQYVTIGKRHDIITPLFLHDPSEIIIIGSAIENKELLNKLN